MKNYILKLSKKQTTFIYAHLNDEKYSVCQIPSLQPELIIPLGMSYRVHGAKLIIEADLSEISAYPYVALYDHFKKLEIPFSSQKGYQFVNDTNQIHGRFSLVFKQRNSSFEISENDSSWAVFYNGNEVGIAVSNNLIGETAFVYAINGQLVQKVKLEKDQNIILQNQGAGIYLVKISGTNIYKKVLKFY